MTKTVSISVGAVLADRYELMAEVARGAMGDVYEAVDRKLGSKVAVKVLRAEYLADESMRRRFRREGAVLKALDHPAIVRLLELEVDTDGMVFFVTEYVEGRTLAERIVEAPLEMEEADSLVTSLCEGLGAAHRHGVLHGDLKPANVLWPEVASKRGPRLIDFGASKILGLDRLTATGEISGTPAYMAPELITGKANVDQRIDVYGLGVLLYEALSGKPAFRETHVGRLMMKIDAGDCLPLDAVTDVPRAVADVVAQAMRRDLNHRHHDMAALRASWEQARSR